MNKDNLQSTRNGDMNLHIWRTGENYALQKGDRYLSEWNNLYFSVLPQPLESEVLFFDVRNPLPYPDNQFDAIYAFHIIEHLSPREGETFLRDLHRILKPNGICRLSTPDLEDIARNYLRQFDACLENPDETNQSRFRWAQLEFYDQMVRTKSGGAMLEYVVEEKYDPAYVLERYGDVFEEFHPEKWVALSRKRNAQASKRSGKHPIRRSFIEKVIRRCKWFLFNRRMEKASREINGDPRKTLEINKWMYDRLSLKIPLEECGFREYKVKTYKDSDIRDWDQFDLDKSNHGDHAIEPSLYVEARK